MRRIYISSTNRVESPEHAPEDRGDAYVVDWATKEVISHLDVLGPENIKKGRSRGCSGITWHQDKIYIACRSGISVFDPINLRHIKDITNVGSGIHEIKSHDNRIYVTNTDTDAFTVIENDEVVERVELRERNLLPDVVMRCTRKNVLCGYNKLHFNSIEWDEQGNMYHLYAAGGIIYNWTRKEIVCKPFGKPSLTHDLLYIGGNRFITNTADGKTFLVDAVERTKKEIRNRPAGALIKNGSRRGFLRGAAYHQQTNTLFLTAAPGQLIAVNTNTWEDIDYMNFSTQEQEAPYGIVLDPRDWEVPYNVWTDPGRKHEETPKRLLARLKKMLYIGHS